jgi:hypothetical protein
MATTRKLKTLIKTAAEAIDLFLVDNHTDRCDYNISPFYDESEVNSEVVTLTFNNVSEFDYEFLEPLAEKLAPSPIKWAINRDDEKFRINFYY